MQQYLTLEEAAKYLQMPPDELREMAKKKTVRAFQDRGTWRFRSQDIEELARARGLGSDAALQLGEAAKPDDEAVAFGKDKSGSGKTGPRSPKPGSDSDVRLVMDSDVGLKGDDSEVRFDQPMGKGSSGKKKPAGDSGVRLEASNDLIADSDVKLDPSSKDSDRRKSKSPSDSDIRLHEASGKKKKDEGNITEEIDLDAEAARLSDKQKTPAKQGKTTQVANPGLPTQSPFELSEPDLELGSKKPGSKPGKKDKDSSSDFEIIAFDSSKSPVELGSGEIPLLKGDEEVALGSEVAGPGSGSSGINLKSPGDSGISLEDGGSDEIEFELSTEAGRTPKPTAKSASRPAKPAKPEAKPPAKGAAKKGAAAEDEEDSSSEFELSLDDDSKAEGSSEFELSPDADSSPSVDSSSEFELSLDDSHDDRNKGKSDESSDSEFELTLDDEGGLAVEEDAADIFEETNFDVPALDDDSGSEAVALEGDSATDVEGSDFEISLDDDSGTGERGESAVVDLDEDQDADPGGATVARRRKTKSPSVVEEDVDVPQRLRDEDEESEDEIPVPVAAEWGPLPAVLLFPTVIVLFVVGIMGFELLRGMWGYHRSSPITAPIVDSLAKTFDLKAK